MVAHMRNPKMPAIHFNTRFIETSKEWFGGGMDVTPSHKDLYEEKMIHNYLKDTCVQNKKNYKKLFHTFYNPLLKLLLRKTRSGILLL